MTTSSRILRGITAASAVTFVTLSWQAVSGAAGQQPPRVLIDSLAGRDSFELYCAACHGSDGRGNGPVAAGLRTAPADLTLLARGNNGAFPRDRVREFIVGTVLAPSLAAFLWFSVFGGSALYLEIWQHVPLADAARAAPATALFAMFDAMPVMAVQAKEGKVTPLAVTGSKRSPALPNVPTIQESGLDYLINGWYGILAPAGTPSPIVQKLRDEAAKAVAPPDVVETLAKQGMEPRGTQPAEWGKYMQSELAFYSKIIKDADIKP